LGTSSSGACQTFTYFRCPEWHPSHRRWPTIGGKENLADHGPSKRENVTVPTTSSKMARHCLSTAELARLEDVFRQEIHPSRQKMKDFAVELEMRVARTLVGCTLHLSEQHTCTIPGVWILVRSRRRRRLARYRDYKTVMIWFQNKRQTSKRGQPPSERSDRTLGRPKVDSCLRAVSSPSHNATLGVSEANSSQRKDPEDGFNAITAKAIVKTKPLLDSLNALTPRSREHSVSMETRRGAPHVKDNDLQQPPSLSENAIAPAELLVNRLRK